jgi:hypothetical protein
LGRTPAELLASTTSAEITEMLAFERLEPFGGLWEDTRMATLIATLANAHRAEGTKPFTPQDVFSTLRPVDDDDGEDEADGVAGAEMSEADRIAQLDAAIFGV